MSTNAERSAFVTVIAWIFIVLTGLATFTSVLQNIIINFVFPMDVIDEVMSDAEASNAPAVLLFLFSNIRLVLFGFLVAAAAAFASAIGLLKRKNWARIAFIVIMAAGIAWVIFATIIQFAVLPKGPETADDPFASSFRMAVIVVHAFSIIVTAGFCLLYGWIIKKLISPRIKAEFVGISDRH